MSINPDLPAFESRSLKLASQVSKETAKSSIRKLPKAREWLSSQQYAEREGISESAAAKRLSRAFSKNYDGLEEIKSRSGEIDGLVVRCVTSEKKTRKYEVLASSLPEIYPCALLEEQSSNDANGFYKDIPSFLNQVKSDIFCDYLSMSQFHDCLELPELNGGRFLVLANDGTTLFGYEATGEFSSDFLLRTSSESLESVAIKYFQHEGSFDSRVFIRVVGNRIDLHGNVGKFRRPDNLFGYSLKDCIAIANSIMIEHGLPIFTGGYYFRGFSQTKQKVVSGYTGATISRIDLTINLSFGHPDDAREYLGWLASQHISRMRNHMHPDGNTVEIGCNDSDSGKSKYIQMIAYNKSVEFQKHSTKHLKRLVRKVQKGTLSLDLDYTTDYYEKLQNYMDSLGVARLELRLKRDYLHQHRDIRFLGALEKDFEQLNEIFIDRWTTATRDFVMKEINQMTAKELELYGAYRTGVDLSTLYSKSAFYRRRSMLLPYGIDISQPYRGDDVAPKISSMRSLSVRSLPMPDFYYLPQVSKVA